MNANWCEPWSCAYRDESSPSTVRCTMLAPACARERECGRSCNDKRIMTRRAMHARAFSESKGAGNEPSFAAVYLYPPICHARVSIAIAMSASVRS